QLLMSPACYCFRLAEEATNNDSTGPDAKTMTRLSEAAQDVDDYRRIVDVLHKRYEIKWYSAMDGPASSASIL
ncbi:hypothetical protein B296_00058041, partial [Ensete ventricosum]